MSLPHIRRFALALVAGTTAALSTAEAQVVVTPSDVSLTPVLNQWYRTNFRDVSTGFTSNTSAAITTTQPRSGNGSVEMSLTNGTGKADYAYTWGFVPSRTLSNLTALSFDWFRQSTSTNPDNQAPALRLLIDADGSEGTTNDRGYLIWEQVYQANPAVLEDQWVSSNAISGNFWQRRFSTGTNIEVYDLSVPEWAAGANPPGALLLGVNTAILGLEVGIGSGWNGEFTGFVDNVTYGFGTVPGTTFNFETAATPVPEPSSFALVGVAVAGLAAGRRRRGQRSC